MDDEIASSLCDASEKKLSLFLVLDFGGEDMIGVVGDLTGAGDDTVDDASDTFLLLLLLLLLIS